MELVPIPSAEDLIIDLRYSSSNNLLGKPIADQTEALLHSTAASALSKAAQALLEEGLRLVIWDAYRTSTTQEILKQQIKDERYVKNNSNHTKGLAVDVTLADKNGIYLDMGTGFDEFGPKAHAESKNLTDHQIGNREMLKSAMQTAGFKQWPYEWWHFDYNPAIARIK